MISYFINHIRLPGISMTLFKNLEVQKLFINKTLCVDIKESKKNNDKSLTENDYKKITDYYGLAVPAILGEAYCILRGRKMTENERMSITYMGALSGLFDDLFDKQDLSEGYIRNLIEYPNTFCGNNSFEKLLIKFYRTGLKHCSDQQRVISFSSQVHAAQILSKKQMSEETGIDEIQKITYLKGGISFLYYRSIFNDHIQNEEINLFHNLGALMQLENDLFDVYKDYQSGIRTLVTTEKNIDNLREIYTKLTEKVIYYVYQTDFRFWNKRRFLRIILLVICRGFVCLDMLKETQKQTDNVFCLEKYKRRNLICDMEKPSNFYKTIQYYAKYRF